MKPTLRPALVLFAALSCITGGLYPAIVTGLSAVAFAEQARGSLIRVNGETLGSRLIGQSFDATGYFWGRPSATTPAYNAAASGASNLGPTHPALIEAARARQEAHGGGAVPIDLVTSSGSGLDPHISVDGALWQVPRVAAERGISEEQARDLVLAHAEGPWLGLFGEPRVNVLEINLALDAAAAADQR